MATKEEIIKDCSEDLILMEKVISPQTFYLPTPDFHYEVTSLMKDRSIIQLLIEAPRGTAKSTHVKGAVIDHCLFDEGDKLVIIQSKTRPEAINRLSAIKEIFGWSPSFIELFGYAGEQVAEMWREDKIKVKITNPLTGNTWNVTIKALGTGQQVRGALEGDTRITLYILDDPEDEDCVKTKESMDDNFSKFLGGVAGLDKRNGRVIVIGTPIRGGCMVERLRNASGWITRHYQNTIDKDKGLYLWEEMYNGTWLENKKKELEELGQRRKYYSEYECEITGEEDQLFREEDFRFYEGYVEVEHSEAFLVLKSLNGVEYPTPKKIAVNTFVGVDPASSTKQTADYSVTLPIAYDMDKNIYVLPYYRQRTIPINHAEDIIAKIKQYAFKRGQVESTAYQEFLRNYLRMRQTEENIYLPGLEHKYNPRTEKSARLEDLQQHFFQHKVHILKNMSELVGEAIMYPRGKHDDLLDGLYYATRKLYPPDHMTEVQKAKKLYREEKELNWMAA
jgi:predicted phage terminase large subunit-like protein